MKLMTLALIGLSTISAVAQMNKQDGPATGSIPDEIFYPPSLNLQIGCPVAFTDVSLKRNGRVMQVKQDTASENSLTFNYRNDSSKKIDSISIRVELKIKRGIYDLDATTIARDMTLTGKSGEVLPLKNLLMYGLNSVTLEQVAYVDGDVWTPGKNKNCRYVSPSSSEEIGLFK
jgi:hypothetical protein